MEYVEIDYDIVKVTDDAILVNDGDGSYWIPKSVVRGGIDIDFDDEDKVMTLDIAEWFAFKEDLI